MAWNLVLTAISLTALVATPAARAAEQPLPYPVRVVTLVTHSSPGGGSDVFLRELTRYLQQVHRRHVHRRERRRRQSERRRCPASRRRAPTAACSTRPTPTYIMTSLLSQPGKTYRDLEPVVNFFSGYRGRLHASRWPLPNARGRPRSRATRPRPLGRCQSVVARSVRLPSGLRAAAGVNAGIVPHNGGGDLMINILNGTLEMGVGEMEELRAQLAGGTVTRARDFRLGTHSDAPRCPDGEGSGLRRRAREVPRPCRAQRDSRPRSFASGTRRRKGSRRS